MLKFVWKQHPFRLLLYLEWILLGIALLALFSLLLPFPLPPSLRVYHLLNLRGKFHLGALISIALLGIFGLRLPFGSRLVRGIYISISFGFSWLAVLFGGRAERVFPALLLIVVIRACVLFPWRDRIIVAVLAYISFLSVLVMSFLRISPLGIPLGRSLPLPMRRLPPKELQSVLVNLALNSAILFGLVLAFVLLLVGAVLAEHQSREKLTTANHRLRQYALMIENQATLQERNRIAREIHDSVGHALTAQSIQLENAALFLTEDTQKAALHLQKARQLGKEALQNVRQSVATLRNYPLQERSLKSLLEKLIEEFKRTTGIKIESEIELFSSLSSEMTTALYRVVQEAFTNISKHSEATLVLFSLQEHEMRIYLKLEDNGRGFNPADNTTGFGLQGMRERVGALGGIFALTSQPDQGCQIKVEIPLLREIR
jgi:signal transduction histidine kinase